MTVLPIPSPRSIARHLRPAFSGLLLAVLATAAAVAQEPSIAVEVPVPPPAPVPVAGDVFSETVDVQVVEVEVFVTDRRTGEPVLGLGKDDFVLRVEGQPVPITNFYAQEGGRPVTLDGPVVPGRRSPDLAVAPPEDPSRQLRLVIFVDHSRLSPTHKKRALEALETMVSEQLTAGDQVTVVSYGRELVFHADLLYDKRAIAEILGEIRRFSAPSNVHELERRQILGELARGQSGGRQAEMALANFDATELGTRIRAYAGDEYQRALTSLRQIEQVAGAMAGLPGRKALLYVSDGIPNRPGEGLFVAWRNRFGAGNVGAELGLPRFDFNTDYRREVGEYELLRDMRQLAERANRDGVTIYALDAAGDHGDEIRSALTEQGGTSETVSTVAANFREPLEYAALATGGVRVEASGLLDRHLATMARDFSTFYSLGFTPEVWVPGVRLDIEVDVRRPRTRVRTRESVERLDVDALAAQEVVSALVLGDATNPLGLRVTPDGEPQPGDGVVVVPMRIEVPVAGLALRPRGDAFATDLTFYVSLKDRAGNPSAVQKVPFHLAIPADKLDDARGRAAHYPLPVVIRPGDQQLVVGVRDDLGADVSAVRLDVSAYSAF